MATFETLEIAGGKSAIYGMRNPLKSGDKSDSNKGEDIGFILGPEDYKLAKSLCQSGAEHRKGMRMVMVGANISAPRYFGSEGDTYKVGTCANSESTMHTITKEQLTRDNFELPKYFVNEWDVDNAFEEGLFVINSVITRYNDYPTETDNDKFGREEEFQNIKTLLPESFIQMRTVCVNYEVLHNMYQQRKNHRLPQWSKDFCSGIETLSYPEFITEKFD